MPMAVEWELPPPVVYSIPPEPVCVITAEHTEAERRFFRPVYKFNGDCAAFGNFLKNRVSHPPDNLKFVCEQVTNGVAVRMAVLYLIAGEGDLDEIIN